MHKPIPTSRLRGAVRRAVPTRLLKRLDEHRVQQTLVCSRVVATPWRFVVNELRGTPGVQSYRLRAGGCVCMHHRSADLGILDEVFRLQWYAPPPSAIRRLEGRPQPLRVVDLGAHVGMFGVWAAIRFASPAITAYEPDPVNLEGLRCVIAANASLARWEVVEACAAPANGVLPFAANRSSGSQVTHVGDPGATSLPARDVFGHLQHADLLKIDIEGSEWPILTDGRFQNLDVPVIVLEYHPQHAPTATPRRTVEAILDTAGYDTIDVWHAPEGVGMLWAVRRRR